MFLSELKANAVDTALTGYPTEVKNSVSKAVRNGLVLMERHHKKDEIRRGGGKSAPVADRWTWRTGALAKSYRIYWKAGALIGYYGSTSKYAKILEDGGTIRPKRAKFLAIPLDAAKSGVGGALSPRHYSDLFMITSRKGNKLLVKANGAGITPMFVLKKSVKLDPRGTIARTEEKTVDKVQGLIADAAIAPLEGK